MKNSATTNYKFRDNQELEITLGYKTMGTLNENKDNVIVVAHSFSSNANFAGEDSKSNKGYWDALIGPDKTIDTNKYFVISFDNLSNVQFYNDDVITTGPRSLNKEGQRYDMSFPIFSFKDIVKIQHQMLVETIGITSVEMVIGGSAGGISTWNWAIEFPDFVKRAVPIITNPKTSSWTKLMLLNTSIKALENDPKWNNGSYDINDQPKEGLALGISAMNCVDFRKDEYEKRYLDDNETLLYSHDDVTPVVKQMYQEMESPLSIMDPLNYYYMCKAMMQHDISQDYGSLDAALKRIKAQLLIISCQSDQIFPYEYNHEAIGLLTKFGNKPEVFEYEHETGHMSGILHPEIYEHKIAELLNK